MKIKEFFTVRTSILLIAIFLALLAINPNPWASGLRISNVQGTAIDSGLQEGMVLQSLNSEQIDSIKEFDDILNSLFEIKNQTMTVETNKGTFAFLTRSKPQIRVEEVPTTNLVKGLDLRGGTIILLQPVPENGSEVTEAQIDDIVKILNNR